MWFFGQELNIEWWKQNLLGCSSGSLGVTNAERNVDCAHVFGSAQMSAGLWAIRVVFWPWIWLHSVHVLRTCMELNLKIMDWFVWERKSYQENSQAGAEEAPVTGGESRTLVTPGEWGLLILKSTAYECFSAHRRGCSCGPGRLGSLPSRQQNLAASFMRYWFWRH